MLAAVSVGGLAGRLVAHREMSAPAAAMSYGGATTALSMVGWMCGLAKGVVILLPFTWLALICAGVLIAQMVETDRLEQVPY